MKLKKQVTGKRGFTDWVLWSITEHFEDLRHFPSGPQVHPETGHGTPSGQADYTGAMREEEKERERRINIQPPFIPEDQVRYMLLNI